MAYGGMAESINFNFVRGKEKSPYAKWLLGEIASKSSDKDIKVFQGIELQGKSRGES